MGAIAGAAVAAVGVISSSNSANAANATAKDGMKMQKNIAGRQLDMADEQYDRYLDLYGDLEKGIVYEAQKGVDYEEAVGTASADVAQAFDKSHEIAKRDLTRYGMDPSSGRFAELESDYTNNRALAEVGARNMARQQVDDESWAKQLTAMNLGKGLPSDAANMMNSAASGYGNYTAQMNNMANQYSQSASKGMQAFGSSMNNVDWGGGYGMSENMSGMDGVNSGSDQDMMLAQQNYGLN
jgi:hypothetical protein